MLYSLFFLETPLNNFNYFTNQKKVGIKPKHQNIALSHTLQWELLMGIVLSNVVDILFHGSDA